MQFNRTPLSSPQLAPAAPSRNRFGFAAGVLVALATAYGAPLLANQSVEREALPASLQGQVLHVGRLDSARSGVVSAGVGSSNVAVPGNPQRAQGQATSGGFSHAVNDADGDTLDALLETAGWDIVIDTAGYGSDAEGSLLTIRTVTSDPNLFDTDGDGLNDGAEFLIGSDPRSADTDGDGLTDAEEWNTWFTNPNTVDTDADSRGPAHNLTPDAFLFDGQELAGDTHVTSPTLADTDGDGRTDQEEFYVPVFHPLIAELPRADIIIAGDLDVRLDVEYEESVAGEVAYEVSLSSSQSSTQGQDESFSTSTSSGWHAETSSTASWEASVTGSSGFPSGIDVEVSASVGGSISETQGSSGEVGQESVFSSNSSSTQESGSMHSNYVSDTNTYTESYASGTVTLPIRISNEGPFSYSVTNLGVTLMMYERPTSPGGSGAFKAMGTIFPELTPATLAPGEQSTIMTLSSSAMNPDVIKAFMAAPDTLILQPASFNLVDQNGVDFDFIQESAFSQTALIEIDFGDGDIESYRVATNVARDGGTYTGVRLGTALSTVLELDYQADALSVDGIPIMGPSGNPIRILTEIDGRATINSLPGAPTQQVWVVLWEGDLSKSEYVADGLGGNHIDFESIRLFPGDSVRLIFSRDQDGDGLWEAEERLFGTSDLVADSDGDGLLDREEGIEGWALDPLLNDDRMVYSDPLSPDTDHDGLEDDEEKDHGLDPRNPDSDLDGVLDGVDPYPSVPAGRRYANISGSLGPAPWDNAGDLNTIFVEVDQANSNGDPTDDISEIWVSSGVYMSPFLVGLVIPSGNVAILGGFHVGDTKVGQRDPDPLTNGCQIVRTSIENYRYLAGTPAGTLDGFALTNGFSSGLGLTQITHWRGIMTLRNLLIANYANNNGSPYSAVQTIESSATLVMEDCILVNNLSKQNGGAVHDRGVNSVYRRCEFSSNQSTPTLDNFTTGYKGGGAFFGSFEGQYTSYGDRPTFIDCQFLYNLVSSGTLPQLGEIAGTRGGGAACIDDQGAIFERCDFVGNAAISKKPDSNNLYTTNHFWGTDNHADDGGAIFMRDGSTLGEGGLLSITNCRFFGNAAGRGSAIAVETPSWYSGLSVINCSFAGNFGLMDGIGGLISSTHNNPSYPGAGAAENWPLMSHGQEMHNSVSAGNYAAGLPPSAVLTEEQVFLANALTMTLEVQYGTHGLTTKIEYSVIEMPTSLGPAWTNIKYDSILHGQLFQKASVGNLRLAGESVAIDFGNNFVDTDTTLIGLQPLSPYDLDGNPRVVNGDGIGGAQVDAGAYEVQ